MDYSEIKRRDAKYMESRNTQHGKTPKKERGNRAPRPPKKKGGGKMIVLICIMAALAVALAVYIWVNTDSKDAVREEITPLPAAATEVMFTAAPTEMPTEAPTPYITEAPSARGQSESIPQDVFDKMKGSSYPSDGSAKISISELSYLTVPYIDFYGNRQEGHMIVAKELAKEVLDIFEELYNIGYPIERMELVDEYNGSDYDSIENNNTSAFNYRESTDGSGNLSQHALGRAIDINPQINPYVDSNGKGSHSNASQYWSRTPESWGNEIAKAAYIGKQREIYRIFTERGWEWGGSWSSYRDYQHFQKKKQEG